MAFYRLYWLDGARRIASAADVISAADDDDAVSQVRGAQRPHRCELWHGQRLVSLVEPEPPADE